jgi:3-methyladenine DNA glycosylase AlkC
MAVQLLLSACLDPAGNIRRGSSAALQELIGRHPNQVIEGISVVQIVDYQAVGLRKRGLIDVAGKAASLDYTYWEALVDGLIAWRGLRSVDVPAREAAALSLANLVSIRDREDGMAIVVERLLASLEDSSSSDIETMHGLVCSLSYLLDLPIDAAASETHNTLHRRFWLAVQSRGVSRVDYNPRSLKSELPVAMAKLVTSVCRVEAGNLEKKENTQDSTVFEDMEDFVHRLLTRHEDPILQVIPNMAKQLVGLQKHSSKSMECISVESLSRAVAADGSKAVLGGSGRAIALGTVALQHDDGPRSDATNFAISTIANLVTARNVDWRIVGLRALHLVLENLDASVKHDLQNMAVIVQAIHAGLTDYTIDERGDIGSLVRLQGLTCVSRLLSTALLTENTEYSELLKSDVLRLSLEKLDRVRARAAECKQTRLPAYFSVEESSNINSQAYLSSALSPIFKPNCPPWALRALIEGAISCAGISAESLLQTSRQILTTSLHSAEIQHVQTLFTVYSEVLRDSVASTTQKASVLVLPALDLLAFFLDMRVLQRLADPETASFKWRSLLSSVQKSHHKSSDVMKLLAAVNVYRGLAEVESIRGEVVKKLLSMLATNPYPRIRVAVAEVVFEVLGAEEMKGVNWAEKGGAVQMEMVAEFKKKFVEGV